MGFTTLTNPTSIIFHLSRKQQALRQRWDALNPLRRRQLLANPQQFLHELQTHLTLPSDAPPSPQTGRPQPATAP